MQEDNPEYYVNSEFTIKIHIGGERNGIELNTQKDTYYLMYQRAYHASEVYSRTDSSELISSPKNFTKLSNHPDISFIEWRKEN